MYKFVETKQNGGCQGFGKRGGYGVLFNGYRVSVGEDDGIVLKRDGGDDYTQCECT